MAGEEEGETLHGSAQRAADVQNLHEAAAAQTQVCLLPFWNNASLCIELIFGSFFDIFCSGI